MKIIGTVIVIVCLVIWLVACLLDRAGVKPPKRKPRQRRIVTFFGYDLLSHSEKQIFTAIHALRCNTELWRGSQWQMIAWNTVTTGDYESFREMCDQIVSEGLHDPEAMERILGRGLWQLLLQYRRKDVARFLLRNDNPEHFGANLGHQL